MSDQVLMHTGVGVRTEIPVGHVMGRGNLLHIFGKLIDEISYVFLAPVMPLLMSPRFIQGSFLCQATIPKIQLTPGLALIPYISKSLTWSDR